MALATKPCWLFCSFQCGTSLILPFKPTHTLGFSCHHISLSPCVLVLLQANLYPRILAAMKPGATLGLSHGFLLGVLKNDGVDFRKDINVVLVAPKVGPLHQRGSCIKGGMSCIKLGHASKGGRAEDEGGVVASSAMFLMRAAFACTVLYCVYISCCLKHCFTWVPPDMPGVCPMWLMNHKESNAPESKGHGPQSKSCLKASFWGNSRLTAGSSTDWASRYPYKP